MKNKVYIVVIIIIIIIIGSILALKNVILKMFFNLQYQEIVEKYSTEYNVDKYLIYATIKAESNFNQNANSAKGAKGLMQLMPSTAKDIASKINISLNDENILEPDININLGTKYISMLIQKYGNIELALASYNAGSGNVDSWVQDDILKGDGSNAENIPYKETNNYVRKILRYYDIYKKLYE